MDRYVYTPLRMAGIRPPLAALKYAREFNREAERIGIGAIASVVGRYYAMDRDKRWERTKLAYDLLTGTDSPLTF